MDTFNKDDLINACKELKLDPDELTMPPFYASAEFIDEFNKSCMDYIQQLKQNK